MIPPRTPLASPTGTLLTELAQTISHVATNVTNIVTTKLLAVEDCTTCRTQFESFLVSQALLGMVDGSIQARSPHPSIRPSALRSLYPSSPLVSRPASSIWAHSTRSGSLSTRSGNRGSKALINAAGAAVAGEAAVVGAVAEGITQSSMVSRQQTQGQPAYNPGGGGPPAWGV
ncbi:unnamed protein product, partial [Cuscuta europaea]